MAGRGRIRRRSSPSQARRIEEASRSLWCSWGRHHTYRYPTAKEHYPNGTICVRCQVAIMGNLEKVLFMPELSEAMRIHARKRWEAQRAQSVASAPLREAAPDVNGVVYYIRINGQVKIGYTKDLSKRSRSYPPGSELLALEPGTRDLERERHRQFLRELARGREWFHESDAMTAHIRTLVDRYGRPEALMHQYKVHEGARKIGGEFA